MLYAVLYRFEVWEAGVRRLVTPESIAASAQAMLAPQLTAIPQLGQVANEPGIVVYDSYQRARQAAQTLASIATTVEVCEVALTNEPPGPYALTVNNALRYRPVAKGLVVQVK